MPKATPAKKTAAKKTAAKKPSDDIDFGTDAENPAIDAPSADDVPVAGEQSQPSELGGLPTLDQGVEYVNGLWWGREGSGKTTDIMTAANFGKVLVVNAEGGLKQKPLREYGITIDNIVPWPAPEDREKLLTYEGMDALFWQLKAELIADPGSWFAVAWDSGSELYKEFVTQETRKQTTKNLMLPVAKQKEHRMDDTFVDRSDYGVATVQMERLLRRFRDLPCHFLITCLERRDVDEETGKVAYGPNVGPAFQQSLLGYVDVTIKTVADEIRVGPDEDVDVIEEFKGLSRSDGKNRAKDRFRSIPRRMSQPTFERVLGYINDTITEEDDPVQKEYREGRARAREYATSKAQD